MIDRARDVSYRTKHNERFRRTLRGEVRARLFQDQQAHRSQQQARYADEHGALYEWAVRYRPQMLAAREKYQSKQRKAAQRPL